MPLKEIESKVKAIECKVSYDRFGPEEVVIVREPSVDLLGYLVIDNTAPGPGKGGLRMAPDVTVGEVCGLARIMTWKCATAGIREAPPFGGAKTAIRADPKKITPERKRLLIEAFAAAIRPFCPSHYISAPDMGTNPSDMDVFVKTIGDRNAATGKTRALGGIDEREGATARGLCYSIGYTLDHYAVDPGQCTVAVMGFGKVGRPTARDLYEKGFKVIAVADSQGGVYDRDGLDVYDLIKLKERSGSVVHYKETYKDAHPNVELITNEAIFRLKKRGRDEKRILIPAAVGGVYDETAAQKIVADFVFEAANDPATTPGVYDVFHRRGIVNINDFIANKGGVVVSYAELNKLLQPETLLVESVEHVLGRLLPVADDRNVPLRTVALELAERRISEKMKERERLRGY